jgi:hypothetical protein
VLHDDEDYLPAAASALGVRLRALRASGNRRDRILFRG